MTSDGAGASGGSSGGGSSSGTRATAPGRSLARLAHVAPARTIASSSVTTLSRSPSPGGTPAKKGKPKRAPSGGAVAAKRRSYTLREKQAAVDKYFSPGADKKKVLAELGLSKSTIYGFQKAVVSVAPALN